MTKFKKTAARYALALSLAMAAFGPAQAALPTAATVAADMGMGWNIGNTMEATGGPTAWGNPLPTLKLIQAVKAAGYKTIRIPTNWDQNANQTTLKINAAWMAQIKQIVDWCVAEDMYAIINIHWDGGWLEDNITTAAQAGVIKKQKAYWGQIAATFKDYDEHVLFASTNEPGMSSSDADINATFISVLNSYHQAFIDTVRATGGNNVTRTLIFQGPKTDIEKTYQKMTTLPTDINGQTGYLMAELHFYPYQFSLMKTPANWGTESNPFMAYPFYYWGDGNHSATDTKHNPTWGEEKFVDSVFNLLKVQFLDKGYPVVIGEFGAMLRSNLSGQNLVQHLASRRAFYKYVASAAHKLGTIVPVAWDPGFQGLYTMTAFDRNSYAITDYTIVNGMREGYGLTALSGEKTYTASDFDNSLKVLYSAYDSLGARVNLGVVDPDVSQYDSIIVRANVKGETQYDSLGETQYGGYLSMNFAAMSINSSKEWTWDDVGFGEVTMNGGWETYSMPFSKSKATGLFLDDPTGMTYFGLQCYSRAYHGAIYIDWIGFKKSDGTIDTLYTFDMLLPSEYAGNVQSVALINNSKVAADNDWETKTVAYDPTPVLDMQKLAHARIGRVGSKLQATFSAAHSGEAWVTVQNMQGRSLYSQHVDVRAGFNTVVLDIPYQGVAMLNIRQAQGAIVSQLVQFR